MRHLFFALTASATLLVTLTASLVAPAHAAISNIVFFLMEDDTIAAFCVDGTVPCIGLPVGADGTLSSSGFSLEDAFILALLDDPQAAELIDGVVLSTQEFAETSNTTTMPVPFAWVFMMTGIAGLTLAHQRRRSGTAIHR